MKIVLTIMIRTFEKKKRINITQRKSLLKVEMVYFCSSFCAVMHANFQQCLLLFFSARQRIFQGFFFCV